MRPVPTFLRVASAALLVPLAAASCARKPLPASPVAAPLSDFEAAYLARTYLEDSGVVNATLRSIEPHPQGKLLAYQTAFLDTDTPPKQWRVIDVRHDGGVREWTFERGE